MHKKCRLVTGKPPLPSSTLFLSIIQIIRHAVFLLTLFYLNPEPCLFLTELVTALEGLLLACLVRGKDIMTGES